MRRRLFNFLSAVSLILWIAGVGVWCFAQFRNVQYIRPLANGYAGAVTARSGIQVARMKTGPQHFLSTTWGLFPANPRDWFLFTGPPAETRMRFAGFAIFVGHGAS